MEKKEEKYNVNLNILINIFNKTNKLTFIYKRNNNYLKIFVSSMQIEKGKQNKKY